MKICMLSEAWKPLWGGGQVHTWELCRTLVRDHGCTVDLYVRALRDSKSDRDPGPGSDAAAPHVEAYMEGKLRVIRVGRATQFENVFSRLGWLIRLLFSVRGKYDLIHAHAFLPGFPAKVLAFFKRIPVIYTVHGTTLFAAPPHGFSKRTLYAVEKFLVTQLNYNALVSVAQNFRGLKVRSKYVEVIPNGVHLRQFVRQESPRFSAQRFNVLYVGRFDAIKRLNLLLEVFREFHVHVPQAMLELVGTGPEETHLKNYARELGIENLVTFSGFLEGNELAAAYHRSDLFVLVSASEGHPLTLFEAWAARVPVLMTSVGDIPYYVKHDHNGILIPPDNAGALLEAMRYAFESPEKRRHWTERACEGLERYTWEAMGDQTFELYQRVTSS